MNKIEILKKIHKNINDYISQNPEYLILNSVIDQIEILIKIANNQIVVDKKLIDQLKLGWIYARELDGFDNILILEDIKIAIKIEREIKAEFNL